MSKKKKYIIKGVRLSDSQVKALKQEAAANDTTVSGLIRQKLNETMRREKNETR